MNHDEIKELIHLIDQSSLKHFELENASVSLKLSKRESEYSPSLADVNQETRLDDLQSVSVTSSNADRESDSIDMTVDSVEENLTSDETLHIIKSPIVGTSYRSSSPDSPPFVKAGEPVEKGQTVLIIEAMKVMNEIKSDVSGIVEEILVGDGQAIEFDQPLIKIKEN